MLKKITMTLLSASLLASANAYAEKVLFTLGTSNSEQDLSVQAMKRWQGAMTEASGGELKMGILPGGAVGSGQQILQQLSTNEIQVSIGGPVVVHQLMKPYQCLEAEYIYRDEAHGYKVWTGEIGKDLSKALEDRYDFSIVGVASRGARQITANKPIRTPEDLAGVKVRVTNSLRSEIFKTYGALPGPLPFSELYGGLRQRVFDAQENPLSAIWAQKFHEVQSTVNLTNHIQSYYIVTANKSFTDSLSEKHREIFFSTLDESVKWLNEQVAAQQASLIARLKAEGMEVVEADVESFRKVALPIVKAYAEENCVPGLLDRIEQVK